MWYTYIKEPFHLIFVSQGRLRKAIYSGSQLILYVLSGVLTFDLYLNLCTVLLNVAIRVRESKR